MNDPSVIPPTDEEMPVSPPLPHKPCGQIEGMIRRHPVVAALTIGCVLSIVARELLVPPPSPKRRALLLLEDIQNRLAEFAEPAQDRASHLAEEGASALKRGLNSVSASKWGSRLSQLFS